MKISISKWPINELFNVNQTRANQKLYLAALRTLDNYFPISLPIDDIP